MPTTSPIGRQTPRVDGPLKVSGNAQYASDFHFPGLLYGMPVEATEEDFIKQNDVQLKRALDLLHEKIGYKRPAAAPAQVSRRPAAHH